MQADERAKPMKNAKIDEEHGTMKNHRKSDNEWMENGKSCLLIFCMKWNFNFMTRMTSSCPPIYILSLIKKTKSPITKWIKIQLQSGAAWKLQ